MQDKLRKASKKSVILGMNRTRMAARRSTVKGSLGISTVGTAASLRALNAVAQGSTKASDAPMPTGQYHPATPKPDSL